MEDRDEEAWFDDGDDDDDDNREEVREGGKEGKETEGGSSSLLDENFDDFLDPLHIGTPLLDETLEGNEVGNDLMSIEVSDTPKVLRRDATEL